MVFVEYVNLNPVPEKHMVILIEKFAIRAQYSYTITLLTDY